MKIAILGTVGVPARYGGFETLADNLVRHAYTRSRGDNLSVYCSGLAYPNRASHFMGARLHYFRLKANGVQSILYDIVTIVHALVRRNDTLLLLGVSGAAALPLVRLLSRARIVTNVDGIEWKRPKWKGAARYFLRLSEAIAVRSSHVVIADNKGIADYLRVRYGIEAEVIAYGGDHAVDERTNAAAATPPAETPASYCLGLCRIEPENNIAMILEAFARSGRPLVFVGNWNNSVYGRKLRQTYRHHPALHLLDPIYEPGQLYAVRAGASAYVHGHSAGGTNPALVEMMHFGIPIFAYDCNFNRYTTEDRALYFASSEELSRLVESGGAEEEENIGCAMVEIARRRYSWDEICGRYFRLFKGTS